MAEHRMVVQAAPVIGALSCKTLYRAMGRRPPLSRGREGQEVALQMLVMMQTLIAQHVGSMQAAHPSAAAACGGVRPVPVPGRCWACQWRHCAHKP